MGYAIAFGVGALAFGTVSGRAATIMLARVASILCLLGFALVGLLALAR